jgi:hypothetical protein
MELVIFKWRLAVLDIFQIAAMFSQDTLNLL